jgi:hypothetical protein
MRFQDAVLQRLGGRPVQPVELVLAHIEEALDEDDAVTRKAAFLVTALVHAPRWSQRGVIAACSLMGRRRLDEVRSAKLERGVGHIVIKESREDQSANPWVRPRLAMRRREMSCREFVAPACRTCRSLYFACRATASVRQRV